MTTIDYEHVSTPVLEKIGDLIRPLCLPESEVAASSWTPIRNHRRVFPETPEHVQIVRQQKKIEKALKSHIEPLYDFLRRARQDNFMFGTPAVEVLGNVISMRKALNDIEDILNGNVDLDETEEDPEEKDANEEEQDADKTQVG
ncbi:hypothetical protein B0H19DRAFT_1086371 [Mycena capillaripes]|nr:hypothetical protein B0H19DRAFT_1086371 [Mycena capillaripes]